MIPSLNVQPVTVPGWQYRAKAPKGRLVVAELPYEPPDGIVKAFEDDKADIGLVVSMGEPTPVAYRGDSWLPSKDSKVVSDAVKPGELVVYDFRKGQIIADAEFGGFQTAETWTRIFGMGSPAFSRTFADVRLTAWWNDVLGVVNMQGEFLRMTGDNVLILADPISDREGNLYLPETVQRTTGLGTVLMAGPLAKLEGVEEGARVSFALTASRTFKVVGKANCFVAKPASIHYVLT